MANRTQRLQDDLCDYVTGHVRDEKKFAFYVRCQTTHTGTFEKSLKTLLKFRAERRKAEIGFEAQKVKTELHELKKQQHHWDVLRKTAKPAA